MELTADKIDLRDKITLRQKKFVKNLIKTKGNGTAAYTMTYGTHGNSSAVGANLMLKKPKIQQALTQELEKHGLTRDYFITKFKDLTNAKDKDGNPDNRIQFDSTKICMELH